MLITSSATTRAAMLVQDPGEELVIVIDPGHGGEDGGAIAEDGTLEKELNLELSKVLCLIFELNGSDVRMLQINKNPSSTDKAIDLIPALFDKVTALFKKDKDEEEKDA